MCFLGFVVSFTVLLVLFPPCAPVPCVPDLFLVFGPQLCTFVFFPWTFLRLSVDIADRFLFRTCLWVLLWTVTITPVCGNACYLSATIVTDNVAGVQMDYRSGFIKHSGAFTEVEDSTLLSHKSWGLQNLSTVPHPLFSGPLFKLEKPFQQGKG